MGKGINHGEIDNSGMSKSQCFWLGFSAACYMVMTALFVLMAIDQ